MENVQQNQCFSQARELFEDIICWLNSESVYGTQHSDLEKNLWTNGNELLRRLLQGYLDIAFFIVTGYKIKLKSARL